MTRILGTLAWLSFALQTTNSAMTVVLLVDFSNSAAMSRASQPGPMDAFIDGLKPGDRATIGGIADHLLLNSQPMTDRRELLDAAQRVMDASAAAHRGGPSPIWDAVDTVVTLLESQSGRRAIVLLTDGKATGNRHGEDDVLRHAVASRVTINIVLEVYADTDAEFSPATSARTLTSATGGTFASYKSIRTGLGREIEGPSVLVKQVMASLHLPRH